MSPSDLTQTENRNPYEAAKAHWPLPVCSFILPATRPLGRFAKRREPVLNEEARQAVTEKYVEMRHREWWSMVVQWCLLGVPFGGKSLKRLKNFIANQSRYGFCKVQVIKCENLHLVMVNCVHHLQILFLDAFVDFISCVISFNS